MIVIANLIDIEMIKESPLISAMLILALCFVGGVIRHHRRKARKSLWDQLF